MFKSNFDGSTGNPYSDVLSWQRCSKRYDRKMAHHTMYVLVFLLDQAFSVEVLSRVPGRGALHSTPNSGKKSKNYSAFVKFHLSINIFLGTKRKISSPQLSGPRYLCINLSKIGVQVEISWTGNQITV